MGLCLHVFGKCSGEDEDPEEIAECDLGPYRYFDTFRASVAQHLGAEPYPVLMEHSKSEGEWTLAEIPALERELREIAGAFKELPPRLGASPSSIPTRRPRSLYDCFTDTSGSNLFKSLLRLCRIARKHKKPITFM